MSGVSRFLKVAGAVAVAVAGVAGTIYYIINKKLDTGWNMVEFLIPKELVGHIMGRKGSNIRLLEAKSNTKIHFCDCDTDPTMAVCTVRGPVGSLLKGRSLIEQQVASIIRGSHLETLLVPSEVVGGIIGRGGDRIKEVSALTGAHVTVERRGDSGQTSRRVTVRGSKEAVTAAVQMIQDKVEQLQLLDRKRNMARRRGHDGDACSEVQNINTGADDDVGNASEMELFVCCVLTPTSMYVQHSGKKFARLAKMVDNMSAYYAESADDMMLSTINVGDIVAALYHCDGKWYRAKVVQIVIDDGSDIESTDELMEQQAREHMKDQEQQGRRYSAPATSYQPPKKADVLADKDDKQRLVVVEESVDDETAAVESDVPLNNNNTDKSVISSKNNEPGADDATINITNTEIAGNEDTTKPTSDDNNSSTVSKPAEVATDEVVSSGADKSDEQQQADQQKESEEKQQSYAKRHSQQHQHMEVDYTNVQFRLFLVDYSDYTVVTIAEICELRADYLMLGHQAFEVQLAGVVPIPSEFAFAEYELSSITRMGDWFNMSAEVVGYKQASWQKSDGGKACGGLEELEEEFETRIDHIYTKVRDMLRDEVPEMYLTDDFIENYVVEENNIHQREIEQLLSKLDRHLYSLMEVDDRLETRTAGHEDDSDFDTDDEKEETSDLAEEMKILQLQHRPETYDIDNKVASDVYLTDEGPQIKNYISTQNEEIKLLRRKLYLFKMVERMAWTSYMRFSKKALRSKAVPLVKLYSTVDGHLVDVAQYLVENGFLQWTEPH